MNKHVMLTICGALLLILAKLVNISQIAYLAFFLISVIAVTYPILGLALAMVVSAFPSHFILPGLESLGTMGRLLILISGASLIFFHRGLRLFPIRPLILPLFLLFWCISSAFWAFDPDETFRSLQVVLINVWLFFLITQFTKEEMYKFTKQLSFASGLIFIYLLYLSFSPVHYFVDNTGRISIDEFTNPNQLGIGSVQLLPFLFFGILFASKLSIKIGFFVSFLSAFILVIRTGSRTSIIATCFLLFFVFFLYRHFFTGKYSMTGKLKGRKFNLVMLLLTILILATLMASKEEILGTTWYKRFDIEKIIASEGETRFAIWPQTVSRIILEYPITGVGLGGMNEMYALTAQGASLSYISHNMILSLLAQLGLVGFAAFFIMIYKAIKKGKRYVRSHPIVWPYLLCIMASLVLGIGETVFMTKLLWLSIAFCVNISLRIPKL